LSLSDAEQYIIDKQIQFKFKITSNMNEIKTQKNSPIVILKINLYINTP